MPATLGGKQCMHGAACATDLPIDTSLQARGVGISRNRRAESMVRPELTYESGLGPTQAAVESARANSRV